MQQDQLKNNSKRIAKNTLFLYLRQILVMLVALYTSRVVLRVLGVVDYGVYNVVGGMVSMFAFLNSALAQATERFIAFGIAKDTIEQQQKTFSMLLNVHMIMALLLFVLCESIGLWFFYNKLVIPAERLDAAFWVMQCSIFTLMISVTFLHRFSVVSEICRILSSSLLPTLMFFADRTSSSFSVEGCSLSIGGGISFPDDKAWCNVLTSILSTLTSSCVLASIRCIFSSCSTN